MFIPIRTDYRMYGRPWVNYALVAANVLLYVAGWHGGNPRMDRWLLHPDCPELGQFFTSMFLHAPGYMSMHLIGNMVFLWVFGNAINDRLGHLAYLAFYLAGGVLAGVGYVVVSGQAPVLGASGAIAAVTGAYLVLFPRIRVTVLVILYFITTMEVSSLYFVGFQVAYNLFMTLTTDVAGLGHSGVAYAAHTSGYVFGMAVGAGLLAGRLLPRDEWDLLQLARAARRRQEYRRMVARGYNPFLGAGPARPWTDQPPPLPGQGRWIETRTIESVPADTPAARELELRRQIADACARHDAHAAVEGYLRLVQIADDAVLSRQNQLDVANQLMAEEQYAAAADAYERFLRHYGSYEHAADVHLLLGIIYGRYLGGYDRAEQALLRAIDLLRDGRKIEQARAELQAVRARRGR